MPRTPALRPFLMLVGAVACGSGGDEGRPVADLRADSNRDGEVRIDDDSDANKRDWNRTTGAVLLANIDDDTDRCALVKNDRTIAFCNDAADDIVNGAEDALDLALLRTRPVHEPPGATGRIVIANANAVGAVRLFRRVGPNMADYRAIDGGTVFSREELEAGLELGIEALDIVRDPEKWDGFVDVQLNVTAGSAMATDTVRMRVAPVLTYHHLLPAEEVWVTTNPTAGNVAMRKSMQNACDGAGVPLRTIPVNDQWTQDFFEPAFMTMPARGGTQHVMRVNYRSPNVVQPKSNELPLRPAGQLVFALRGKDVAGVQQVDLGHNPKMDSLNSFGNFETVPPYEKDGVAYPFGRVLRGATSSWYPDRSFVRMIDAQAQQPAIEIDTSWLFVGHVDETLSFVKAPTARGWKVLVSDPALAKGLLENAAKAGDGDAPMFVGKKWIDFDTDGESPAQTTIAKVLGDKLVIQASAEAAVDIDAQLEVLRRELGLTDDEVISVPFLHTTYDGKSIAYQPGTVNGLYLSETHFGAPDPHGPVSAGKDIFKAALAEPLEALGITVDWIEDWDGYHRELGEVHCGSNATRAVPNERWWESGR